MNKRINIDNLPEFDAAPYLDSETSIAAYLTDILAANDAGLLAAALGDIARVEWLRSQISGLYCLPERKRYKPLIIIESILLCSSYR